MRESPAPTVPILYSFRRCPWAMRARMALAASSIQCAVREVSLQNKPAAMLAASPKGTVPVLVLPDGRVIDESLAIMCWALEQHYPPQWLPDDAMQEITQSMIACIEGPFLFHLVRTKYASHYPGADPAEHRAEAGKLLEPLEQRLRKHAYLFGDAPSLADVATFTLVRQFAHADAAAFAAMQLPRVQRWLTQWEGSELFQSVMTKHPIWQPEDEATYT